MKPATSLFIGMSWIALLAVASPAWAQQPAAPPTLPPPAARRIPNFPEPPAHATRAQENEYERQRWNWAFTDSIWRRKRFNTQPNQLLVETVRGLKPGTALDMGMGEGRNTVYLARLGWQATGVDIADQAEAFAQARAKEAGVKITTVLHDGDTYDWGRNKWDLVLLCYGGGREHVQRALKSLKPGGLLVLEGFHHDADPDNKHGATGVTFGTNEIRDLYAAAGFRILRYEEPVGVADFSKETVRLVKLVAQKPQ